jgi:chromosome segregation ATPase
MKIDFTNTEFRTNLFGLLFSAIVLLTLVLFSGCSAGIEKNGSSNQINYSGDKSFSFKNEGSDWRADFNDNEISALYKDGVRIPDNEIEKNREMVYEKLNGLKSDYKNLFGNVNHFHMDLDKFYHEMEKFKKDFDDDKFMHFKLEFDDDEFEKDMEKLQEKLKELNDKKIDLHINSDEFKKNMKDLQEDLKNLPDPPNAPDIDIDINLNMEDFKEGMKNFGEDFKNFDLKIDSSDFDMSELRKNMNELKNHLKGLKIEVHGLKGEMKKLDSFLDDLKSELVKDGYLNSTEEEYDLEMSAANTKVNDINVKEADHKKYKELYKKYFDKEIDGTIKINRD